MTHQPSFSKAEFAAKKKTTRRERFLTRMEALIPWTQLLADLRRRSKKAADPLGQTQTRLRTEAAGQIYLLRRTHFHPPKI